MSAQTQRCPYYTDGRHRHTDTTGPMGKACACGDTSMTLLDLIDAPARRRDPYSSRQAAERSKRKARSQAERALEMIAQADAAGASTREIQEALYSPGDPAWNKVATRCLDLQRKGLVRRLDETREHQGQHFLIYEITAAGRDTLADRQ